MSCYTVLRCFWQLAYSNQAFPKGLFGARASWTRHSLKAAKDNAPSPHCPFPLAVPLFFSRTRSTPTACRRPLFTFKTEDSQDPIHCAHVKPHETHT